MKSDEQKLLEKARRFARKAFVAHRDSLSRRQHPSHSAEDVLFLTEREFPELKTCGVEGWCDDIGNNGVSYLNTGEMYQPTIAWVSSRQQFIIASQELLIQRYYK
jgi:hypothetical protein